MQSAVRKHLVWREATVLEARSESSSARTLRLDVPDWGDHLGGQHLDLRLTADDGYQATRSYSVSSGPGEDPEITVERVEDGEVSPYLVDDVEVGDIFEVRGPIGGYFVWDDTGDGHPLVLIGGGSGIAPLRAIWRHAKEKVPVTVLYSARDQSRIIFGDEIAGTSGVDAHIYLTRETAEGYLDGRIDEKAIADAVGDTKPSVFVCGPTAFVEAVATHLVAVDVDPKSIRTERFG